MGYLETIRLLTEEDCLTMMKDQKESFMDKDVLGGSPISINSIGCREYMFGKNSGIRKTEKVLQEPVIGASFMSECWNSIWRPNVTRQDKQ